MITDFKKGLFMFENRQEVAWKAEDEGLGYFILNYTNSDSMPDEEMKKAFEKAENALREFEKLLEDCENE